jgi:hypothetical protein
LGAGVYGARVRIDALAEMRDELVARLVHAVLRAAAE